MSCMTSLVLVETAAAAEEEEAEAAAVTMVTLIVSSAQPSILHVSFSVDHLVFSVMSTAYKSMSTAPTHTATTKSQAKGISQIYFSCSITTQYIFFFQKGFPSVHFTKTRIYSKKKHQLTLMRIDIS
mmetsp:Transcript_18837/g.24939  ORF Transcript_18837/g.24939 Transcript_18837/m.24939 type:complete len:127 (-) Transcript_18837:477-857(-)